MYRTTGLGGWSFQFILALSLMRFHKKSWELEFQKHWIQVHFGHILALWHWQSHLASLHFFPALFSDDDVLYKVIVKIKKENTYMCYPIWQPYTAIYIKIKLKISSSLILVPLFKCSIVTHDGIKQIYNISITVPNYIGQFWQSSFYSSIER